MRAPASLEPRKRPVRANAKASVDRILDAAAALLDESGFEALTTIRIAERAQVNIASLYSYFPNKHAVLETGLAATALAGVDGPGAFRVQRRVAIGERRSVEIQTHEILTQPSADIGDERFQDRRFRRVDHRLPVRSVADGSSTVGAWAGDGSCKKLPASRCACNSSSSRARNSASP